MVLEGLVSSMKPEYTHIAVLDLWESVKYQGRTKWAFDAPNISPVYRRGTRVNKVTL